MSDARPKTPHPSLTHRQNEILAAILLGQDASATATTVDEAVELAKKQNATRREAIDLLRRLAELGLGAFKAGRKGGKSRLVWNAGAQPSLREPATQPANGSAMNGDLTHAYRLRPDRTVEVRLPVDLTSDEAERFATFIRTLPFGKSTTATG